MNLDINSILNFLREAVIELKDIEPEDILAGTELASMDLDSLDYVDIQVNIRREYGVQVQADVFASGQIKTFGQLAEYIARQAAAKQLALAA
jgi:acyl carrier protein